MRRPHVSTCELAARSEVNRRTLPWWLPYLVIQFEEMDSILHLFGGEDKVNPASISGEDEVNPASIGEEDEAELPKEMKEGMENQSVGGRVIIGEMMGL